MTALQPVDSCSLDYAVFANRSHMIVAQEGWQDVAEYAITRVERRLSGCYIRMPRCDINAMRPALPSYAGAQVARPAM
jgi:hypothetical protein